MRQLWHSNSFESLESFQIRFHIFASLFYFLGFTISRLWLTANHWRDVYRHQIGREGENRPRVSEGRGSKCSLVIKSVGFWIFLRSRSFSSFIIFERISAFRLSFRGFQNAVCDHFSHFSALIGCFRANTDPFWPIIGLFWTDPKLIILRVVQTSAFQAI